MALPLSLTQPFREGQLLVGGGWRGFFAPFNAAAARASTSTSIGPTILDLQVSGPFNESAPPTNFFDLGWISKFKITPGSKIGSVRSGYRGAVRAQYRGEVGETFELSFNEMSRMAYKIATGTEIFNLLSNSGATASSLGPLSSSGAIAQPLGASGYVASGIGGKPTLYVPAGTGSLYPAGTLIVCDDDYANQYGLVGAAGINVFNNAVTDVDFIRKTSDFVARVVSVTPNAAPGQDALILNKPFIGGGNAATGTPPTGPDSAAKIQVIKGYAAREGGSFITQWSALFCMDTIDGSQLAIYYPHVAPNQFKDFASVQIENAGTTDLARSTLDAVMTALAFDDPLDGETVVRYAAYYPSPGLDPQI